MVKTPLLAVLSLVLLASPASLYAGQNAQKKKSPGSKPLSPAQYRNPRIAAPGAVRAKASGDLVYGAPVVYRNLSLVPVGTTQQGPFQKYTLLEEGLGQKTLLVRELNGQSDQAQVNAVEVKNTGAHPVYLLGGEMILGGKQDRIIQNDTVVPDNGRWTKVAVFCVEQGRWRGQNMKFAAGKALVDVSVRQAALSGKQGNVWAAVARKNRKHGTQSNTDTYRRTIQSEKLRQKIAPYRREIAKLLPQEMKLAGFIFAINGKIRVADLFGNPVLFASLQDKLLSAYILEALSHQVKRNARAISSSQAKSFVDKARQTKKVKMHSKSGGRSANYKMENDQQVGTEVVDQKTGKRLRETFIGKQKQ